MSRAWKHVLCAGTMIALGTAPVVWRIARVHYRLYAASTQLQPFTVDQHEEVTGPHVGVSAQTLTRTIAMRGDGSKVTITREPRNGWIEREIALANGFLLSVHDEIKAVSTMYLPPDLWKEHLRASLDPSTNCTLPFNGRQGPHPNVVQGFEYRFEIPVVKILNSSGNTVWEAPSLDCTMLERSVDWKPSEPGTNTTLLKLDRVTLGEPDQGIFSVPADYTEMPPSQARALHLQFANIPEAAAQKIIAGYTKSDQAYFSHRPPATH